MKFFKKKKGKDEAGNDAPDNGETQHEHDNPPESSDDPENSSVEPEPVRPESYSMDEEDLTDPAPKKGFFSRFRKQSKPTDTRDDALEATTESAADTEESSDPQEKKRGLFKRLRDRLTKTRKAFVNRVDALLLGKKEIDEDLLEELEEILITSDIGVHTSMRLIEAVREKIERKDLDSPEELRQALQAQMESFLQVETTPAPGSEEHKPHVIMVVGVNGVGKTTTIGKLAARYMNENKQVLLVAADTFRAAAVEQLQIWSQRIGCDIVKHTGKSDPSAVAYDGIQAAKSRDADVVIIDTAGRLHTKANLMEELKKIRRTVAGQLSGAPHEVLLVLDATTGQNAISQAELFDEALELTGIALTKLDGTAKGGIVVGICERLGVPLKYIGIGEKLDDLQAFDANEFIQALF